MSAGTAISTAGDQDDEDQDDAPSCQTGNRCTQAVECYAGCTALSPSSNDPLPAACMRCVLFMILLGLSTFTRGLVEKMEECICSPPAQLACQPPAAEPVAAAGFSP